MPNVPVDQLTSAKQQVLALFGRPSSTSPDVQNGWRQAWGARYPGYQSDPAYLYGTANLIGCAVRDLQDPGLQLYLASGKPGNGPLAMLPEFLPKVIPDQFPAIPVQVIVTGKFRACLGINLGAGITLDPYNDSGTGMIALFLKDSNKNPTTYALTCQHVLDGEIGDDVYVNGDSIGTLVALITPNIGLPSTTSTGDAALVRLNKGVYTNGLPAGTVKGAGVTHVTGLSITQTPITLINHNLDSAGAVQSPSADLWIEYPNGPASFNNLITVSGVNVRPGDSGSVGIVTGSSASAMLLARSDDGVDSNGKKIGPLAVLIDMQRTLGLLNPMIKSILSLLT